MMKIYLWAILGILVLGGGMFVLSLVHFTKQAENNQITITPTPTGGHSFLDSTTPDIVAANFYTAYQNCMRAGVNQSTTLTLSQFCQTSAHLTLPSFDEKIKAQTPNHSGIDPVFCAEAPPVRINKDLILGSPNIVGENAAVPITAIYGDKKITILFSFQKNSLGEWRIANLVCQ